MKFLLIYVSIEELGIHFFSCFIFMTLRENKSIYELKFKFEASKIQMKSVNIVDVFTEMPVLFTK